MRTCKSENAEEIELSRGGAPLKLVDRNLSGVGSLFQVCANTTTNDKGMEEENLSVGIHSE